jgi:hypothetical protein
VLTGAAAKSAKSIPAGTVPDVALLDTSAAEAALATSDRLVILGRG